MCSCCRHRWLATYIPDTDRALHIDDFGDHHPEPPKEVCPSCGRRYSLRGFIDVSLIKQTDDAIFNLDPFTGVELPMEVTP